VKTTERAIEEFYTELWQYYREHGRQLPWRPPALALSAGGILDPYAIMVSEIMLQQTGVARVTAKYQEFLEVFPTFQALAGAKLSEVLIVWSGLGYNRRAKFLHQAAQKVVDHYQGRIPRTQKDLVSLRGIGPNTAGAILTYAFNEPCIFIETNIRTVYIHHYFEEHPEVTDAHITDLLKQTLAIEARQPEPNYRELYWALMDYGSYLKKEVGSLLHQSKAYTKQSVFEGSRRQIRGKILKLLAQQPLNVTDLHGIIDDERLEAVLADLAQENIIEKTGEHYSLPQS